MTRPGLSGLIASPLPWILLLGGIASLFAMQWHVGRIQGKAQDAIDSTTARIGDEVQRRLELYQYGLRGARGAVITAGEDGIDHRTFLRYAQTRDVDREFRGARGFGFIRRVAEEQLESFLARARQQRPDFALRELGPHQDEHFVIEFIEPVDRNHLAVGLDIGSESNRRAAAERSMREGTTIATAPITLVQASGSEAQGLLVLLPVYRTAVTPESTQERERQLIGWSYAPLLMSEVLADVDREYTGLHLEVVDAEVAGDPHTATPLFESGTRPSQALETASVRRAIFGRTWIISARSNPSFRDALQLGDPRETLVAGLLTTLLLALLAEAVRQARQRRRELQLEQQRVSEIVAHASDAMFGESPSGEITFWNPSAERLFGVAAAQAVGRPLGEFARVTEEQAEALEGAANEKTIELQDGRRLEVQFSRSAVRDDDGTVRGFSCVVHDVSLLKEAERRLRDFNARLEAQVSERTRELEATRSELEMVLDAVPLLIASWDRALRCRVANRTSARWFQCADEHRAGQPIDLLWGRIYRERLQPVLGQVFAGLPVELEIQLDSDEVGRTRQTQWRLIPERDHDDSVCGFLAVAVDVTEIAQSRDALEVERSRLAETARTLQSVLRAASEVSIIATDVAGTVILFNAGAERMLGYPAAAVIGRMTLPQFIDSSELERRARQLQGEDGVAPSIFQALVQRAELEGAETREWHYLTESGRWIEVSQTVTAMRNEDDEVVGYLSVARDITESRRAEQAKSAFVATVSHELRTPLTVILGSLDLVNSGALGSLSAEAAELLRAAQLNGKRLGLLINDLLDAEKLAAGMLVFNLEPINLGEAVGSAVDSTRDYLSDRGIAIEIEGPASAVTLHADPLRFSQVLVNLLSNAIKFSPASKPVEVRCLQRGSEALIGIRDYGPGIPESFRPRVFERFSQADDSDHRPRGGTGLGLAISRDLVRGMNGRIWFEDAPGGGTCFWLAFAAL